MHHAILAKIRRAEDLPSLPTVALEVLKLVRAEDVSLDALARVIENDPALAGKILRTVNSSLYGVPREIASIRQAVSLLGLRTVKVLALSFSLAETVNSSPADGLDLELYWRGSISCAVAARHIAQAVCPQRADEAFVAGLLADAGIVAAWRCAREEYEPVLAARSQQQRPLVDIERERFGFTHARMSLELLRTWGLPQDVCDAVGAHNGEPLEDESTEANPLLPVVRCAAAIADLFCRHTDPGRLDEVKAECLRATGIAPPMLEEVLHELDHRVRETASNLSVSIGQTIDYARLQMEAAAQLARISMQAEIERTQSERAAELARLEAHRLHEEKKRILEVASTDALTGLANRAAFDARLDETLQQARRDRLPVALIMIDVDHFKHFNDTYGHRAGDAVLRGVGRCLRQIARCSGFAARYGGEEFVFLLSGRPVAAAPRVAELIRRSIAGREFEYEQQRLRVTVSVGLFVVDPAATPLGSAQMIEGADRCMYRAKRAGRNRVETEKCGPVPVH